jgi:hypothetical protein
MADASCMGVLGRRCGFKGGPPHVSKARHGSPRVEAGRERLPTQDLHGGGMVDVYLRRNCDGLFGIDEVAELLRGFEERDFLGWDFYFGSGFGIASYARVSLARTEASKSPDFDLVAGFQGSDD